MVTKQTEPCMANVSGDAMRDRNTSSHLDDIVIDADVAIDDDAARDRDTSSHPCRHLDDMVIDAGEAIDDDATGDCDTSSNPDDIVIDTAVAMDHTDEDGTVQGFTEAAIAFVRTFPHTPIVLVLTTACMLFVIFDDAPSLSADINVAGRQRLRSQQVIIASLLELANVTLEHVPSGPETIRTMRLNQAHMSANYGVRGSPELQDFASAFEQNSTDKQLWAMSVLKSGSRFLQVADKNVKILEQKATNQSAMRFYFLIGLCCMEVIAIGVLAWVTPRRNWLDMIEAARALDMAESRQAEAESRAKAYQTITSILSHDLRGVSSNAIINTDILRDILDELRSPEGSCAIQDPVTNEMIGTLMTSIVSDNTHVQYAVRSVQMVSNIINQTEDHVPGNEDFDLVHLIDHFMTMYPTVRVEEITTLSSIFRGDQVAIPLSLLLP